MECYDQITEAIAKLPEAEKCGTLTKGQKISVAGAEITVMNEPFACTENSFNNSSVAYRVEMGGKRILFLGDMGWQAGEDFLANHTQEELKSDVLQMAHHGQRGVEEELYQEISPEVCLWPTPDWLWDNVQDGVAGAGSYKTPIVRGWMVTLGVKKKSLCQGWRSDTAVVFFIKGLKTKIFKKGLFLQGKLKGFLGMRLQRIEIRHERKNERNRRKKKKVNKTGKCGRKQSPTSGSAAFRTFIHLCGVGCLPVPHAGPQTPGENGDNFRPESIFGGYHGD